MIDGTSKPNAPPLRGKLLRGTAWIVASKWVIRLIGLANTAVLARVLVPDDFGVVAMCMVVVGMLDAALNLDIPSVLIQRKETTREQWDTAFTLQAIQGVGTTILIIALTPAAVAYFNEPAIAYLLPFLSIRALIQGFENIGIVAFRRELDFRRDFYFMVLRKVASVTITIVCALTLRSYWALAIGIVMGQTITTGLSYRLHSFRPRFTLRAFRELWGASRNLMLSNIAWYIQIQGDELIVGGLFPVRRLGTYTVASQIAELPTAEVALPMMRVLFPGFSRLQGEPKRLASAYLKVLGVSATIALPFSIGISLVSEFVVPLVLGDRWLDAIPLLGLLAFHGGLRMLYGNIGAVILAGGQYRTLARGSWIHAVILMIGLTLAAQMGDLWFFCLIKVILGCFFLALWFALLVRTIPVRPQEILTCIYRPAVAAATMYGVVLAAKPFLPDQLLLGLVSTVALGAVVFTTALLSVWRLSGAGDGAERFMLELLSTRVWAPIRRRLRRPPRAP